ncbi:D-mannose binding lectin protein with Apple-like carbohydrate-binding domain-containing protein [Actinidia rufa]|uniref:D-mannose binding lectin protein with Apple-like carbohydrate-binding domain-containing protein n=1 Tax=Actinidia rufa TaxID=165716 RepID=A0A7J0FUX0_9ERIC|nr:D-mannose binding lectin protein with Apple-like carbohydrate-binding domain-containing protein [Actinidia rufa]
MEKKPINSVTRCLLTQLLYTSLCVLFSATRVRAGATATRELLRGFTATPDPSISPFQALLDDSTGNYSLGFLRVNRVQLDLAVVHVPSSEPLWVANPTRPPGWSAQTRVFFNGSLVISDPHTGAFWSTETSGDRVWLSNTSNLQIQKLDDSPSVLWERPNFIGLYAKFNGEHEPDQIYLRHKALEAKAEVIEGQGPIYIILSSDGYLGMYQNGSVPVDVQPFSTFQQTRSGTRRIRLEPDGNLKGYYWTGSNWVLDYEAIPDPCELPSSCGSYGLCQPGLGCSCLDNHSDYNSGRCGPPEKNSFSGDFCGPNEGKYWVLRRKGVELPYKELMGYEKMDSLAQCEKSCGENCTCWGAVYSNSSGFCYTIDYPIQSLLVVGDVTKVGYFKVRVSAGKKGVEVGYEVGIGLLCVAVLVFGVVVGFGLYRVRSRKRGVSGYLEEDSGVEVGPYKNLGSASCRSIELCDR